MLFNVLNDCIKVLLEDLKVLLGDNVLLEDLKVLLGDNVLLEDLKVLLGDNVLLEDLKVLLLGDKVGLRHNWGFLWTSKIFE
jgi:hypothetical protein